MVWPKMAGSTCKETQSRIRVKHGLKRGLLIGGGQPAPEWRKVMVISESPVRIPPVVKSATMFSPPLVGPMPCL